MKYFFILILISTFTSLAQTNKKNTIKIVKDELENYSLVNPSDSTFVLITNSIIKGFALKKELPNGEYSIYVNNKLKSVYTIKNNKFEGQNSIYYDNGNISRIRFFKNGEREGLHKLFYETGELLEEVNYSNGKTVGVSKTYYTNGSIKSKAYYEEDKLKKIEKFDEQGNLISTKDYNQ
ncbi:toxin-antitoxin system YwqK family antitoxin [Flavobacterium sp. GCM10027622]|uniref:toxin-antitoxin system YwqK family antitoxin n=1 Tax=unclassified Flavobacterium TaxID=196869 RepID=UPI0036189758